MARFYVGKILELMGISTLGLALLYGIHENDMRREYLFFGVGGAFFLAGYLLERAKRNG